MLKTVMSGCRYADDYIIYKYMRKTYSGNYFKLHLNVY